MKPIAAASVITQIPLGRRLPELERCMIRHRALQTILIVYHAEELKRDIIGGVAVQQRWREVDGADAASNPKSR